jgi:hypothetical protein
MNKKKKKKKKKENSKDQAASPNKREDLSPLELFTASGFDLSQIAGLSVSKLLIWINTHRSDILSPLLSSGPLTGAAHVTGSQWPRVILQVASMSSCQCVALCHLQLITKLLMKIVSQLFNHCHDTLQLSVWHVCYCFSKEWCAQTLPPPLADAMILLLSCLLD